MNAHSAPIGWGLVGTGLICNQMAWALSHVPEARLAAVGSRDEARARAFVESHRERHPHARGHGSYRALVEDPAVDVVYIGTPHPDHVHSMQLALRAGKAVLCEKPFTLHRAEAAQAVALARERGLFLMEAMWTRLLPAMLALERLLDDGVIGECVGVTAELAFRLSADPAHRTLARELGGGALLDLGIYPLSFASFVLGPIRAVQAMAEIGPTGVDVHTVFNLQHASGRISQGVCSLRGTGANRATVQGTLARIEIEPPFQAAQALRIVREGRSDERIELPWRGNGFVPQVEEVHRCLREGLRESPAMPLDESLALMGWMDAMRAQIGLRYPQEGGPGTP